MDGVDFATKMGRVSAEQERKEHNKGKGHASKDWETWEETRQKAAEKTIGILTLIAAITLLIKLGKRYACKYNMAYAIVLVIADLMCIYQFFAGIIDWMTWGIFHFSFFWPSIYVCAMHLTLHYLYSEKSLALRLKVGVKKLHLIAIVVFVAILWCWSAQ